MKDKRQFEWFTLALSACTESAGGKSPCSRYAVFTVMAKHSHMCPAFATTENGGRIA